MRVIVERDKLIAALARLRGIKSDIPILNNALIEAAGERIRVMTHGLDFCCEATSEAEVENDGACTVKLTDFASLINLANAGAQVSLAIDGTFLGIKFGRSSYKLPTLPASDFPNPLKCEPSDKLDLTADETRRLFDDPQAAMGDDKTPKEIYKGIYLHSTDKGFVGACATTGLHLIRTTVNIERKIKHPIIIPHDVTRDIVKAAKAGPVHLEWSDTALRVVSGDFTLTTKLIDGEFPDYQNSVLGGNDHPYLKFNRADVIDALSRLCLVAPEKGIVVFAWDKAAAVTKITFENVAEEFAFEQVDSDGDGMKRGEFRVAPRMFLSLLSAVDSEIVYIVVEKRMHWWQLRIMKPSQPTYVALQALVDSGQLDAIAKSNEEITEDKEDAA